MFVVGCKVTIFSQNKPYTFYGKMWMEYGKSLEEYENS